MFLILLRFLKSNSTMRSLEYTFQYSKTCINNMLPLACNTLNTVLKKMTDNFFPNRNERDNLRLPAVLVGTGVFGSVDTVKIESLESCQWETTALHKERHKGMGLFVTIICNVPTNQPIVMSIADGHEHALTSYRSTVFFQQKYDHLKIDDDETLIGDSAYTGNVVNNIYWASNYCTTNRTG